jgi:hypothetical protein
MRSGSRSRLGGTSEEKKTVPLGDGQGGHRIDAVSRAKVRPLAAGLWARPVAAVPAEGRAAAVRLTRRPTEREACS